MDSQFAVPFPPGLVGYSPGVVIGKSAIPFIALSSGSVAANGAISAITALPFTYPDAYCWFPANALATVKAAGWYYCTFSSTVAGTAFLDTYVSGLPVIPVAPQAVVDGKGAFVGDTGEEFYPRIAIPANALGPNGVLRYKATMGCNNTANVKTFRARYSGVAGTILASQALTSSTGALFAGEIANRAGAAKQAASIAGITLGVGAIGSSLTQGAIDTTAATELALSLQRATATDNIILESFCVELLYGA